MEYGKIYTATEMWGTELITAHRKRILDSETETGWREYGQRHLSEVKCIICCDERLDRTNGSLEDV
jgi:hypothetical protein